MGSARAAYSGHGRSFGRAKVRWLLSGLVLDLRELLLRQDWDRQPVHVHAVVLEAAQLCASNLQIKSRHHVSLVLRLQQTLRFDGILRPKARLLSGLVVDAVKNSPPAPEQSE